jgi:hemin uptake protein HemP
MPRDTPAPQRYTSAPVAPLRRINSRELLGAAQEVEISHTGQIYRLRLTALGKLIPTASPRQPRRLPHRQRGAHDQGLACTSPTSKTSNLPCPAPAA